MKLKVGGKYRTRDGRTARVFSIDDFVDFPIIGMIEDSGKYERWRICGSYNVEKKESPLDLIEEIL